MRRILGTTVQFLRREDGPTAVECALMLGLVVLACIVAGRQLTPGGQVGAPVMIVERR